MKNLKQKIGALLLGVGLATGGYFVGHYMPKHVTIDNFFIKEFESIQPGLLDKKLELIKGNFGHVELSNKKDIDILFLGSWNSYNPYHIDLKYIWIYHKDKGDKTILTVYYAPGVKDPEFFKNERTTVEGMTVKEKLLWEKLYEELAK